MLALLQGFSGERKKVIELSMKPREEKKKYFRLGRSARREIIKFGFCR